MAINTGLVDIIIPYSSYHVSIVDQAVSSAKAQTLPCGVITYYDKEGKGAGFARNRAVELSNALFILPLDADDTIRYDAVELLLKSYKRSHYVYSDDIQGDSLHQTPDCNPYLDGTWHTVNALVPTAAFKAIGGFDETLPALEDLDFFLRLQAHGVCGVRCPHPLVRYTGGGQRSQTFRQRPDYKQQKLAIYERWSGAAKMGCNCGATVSGVIPDGKQDADILVTALYTPMQMGGPVTGRLYPRPRGANSYQIWVDPADLDHPNGRKLWSPVMTVDKDATPAVDEVVRLAREAMGQ